MRNGKTEDVVDGPVGSVEPKARRMNERKLLAVEDMVMMNGRETSRMNEGLMRGR